MQCRIQTNLHRLGRYNVSPSTPEEFVFDVVPFTVACLGAWPVWPYNSLLRQLVGFVLAVYVFFWGCRFIIMLVTALRLRKLR
jgi:hypothetical protein